MTENSFFASPKGLVGSGILLLCLILLITVYFNSSSKRTLTLHEDDLIMVIDKDVVRQIDENRGEMNRTEFANFLIHNQLKEFENNRNYVDKEEFHQTVQEIKQLFCNFLDFFLSLELAKQPQDNNFEEFLHKVEAINNQDETANNL